MFTTVKQLSRLMAFVSWSYVLVLRFAKSQIHVLPGPRATAGAAAAGAASTRAANTAHDRDAAELAQQLHPEHGLRPIWIRSCCQRKAEPRTLQSSRGLHDDGQGGLQGFLRFHLFAHCGLAAPL